MLVHLAYTMLATTRMLHFLARSHALRCVDNNTDAADREAGRWELVFTGGA